MGQILPPLRRLLVKIGLTGYLEIPLPIPEAAVNCSLGLNWHSAAWGSGNCKDSLQPSLYPYLCSAWHRSVLRIWPHHSTLGIYRGPISTYLNLNFTHFSYYIQLVLASPYLLSLHNPSYLCPSNTCMTFSHLQQLFIQAMHIQLLKSSLINVSLQPTHHFVEFLLLKILW